MTDRPNVLFVLTDEQRFDTLPCYGAHWLDTPNLDRLAEESFVFENAYVSQPVCAPARSTIMTGLYPHTTGVTINSLHLKPDALTIAEMVDKSYTCGNFGRWHLGDDMIPQHGFTEWNIIELGIYSDYSRHLEGLGYKPDMDWAGGKIFSAEFRSALPAEHAISTYLADATEEFIKCRKTPFVLIVSLHDPHPPYTGPLDGHYDPAKLPVGPAFLQKPSMDKPLVVRLKAKAYENSTMQGFDLSREDAWRQLRAGYYGNVTFMDRAVGRMLKALENEGLDENTIVVFTSEHGDMLGDHGLFGKRFLYEPSARVPFLMRVPWLGRHNRRIPGNFSHIDLVPTLLELTGHEVPEHLQGQSRAGVFRGEESLEDNDVIVQHNGIGEEKGLQITLMNSIPWRSVITADRWKLNLAAGDHCELYDLNADPHELHNLIDRPEHRDRVRLMAAKIRLWQHETGDTAPLPATT